MGVGEVGFGVQRRLVLLQRRAHLPSPVQNGPEVVVRLRILGVDFERQAEVALRGLDLAPAGLECPQRAVRERVPRLDAEDVAPQRLAIAPAADLSPGHGAQRDEHDRRGRHGRRSRRRRPRLEQPAEARAREQREPQARQVRVAVRSQLASEGDDPRDGEQRDEVDHPRGQARRESPSREEQPDARE